MAQSYEAQPDDDENESQSRLGGDQVSYGLAILSGALLLVIVIMAVYISLYLRSPQPTLWNMYFSLVKDAKHIDLTHPIAPNMSVWAGFGPPTVGVGKVGVSMDGFAQEGEEWSYAKHGFMTTSYTFTTDQLGTQLDPPAHWNELGATISDVPATVAVRPLVVIDVHEEVAADPGYTATRADCEAWEAKYGEIPEGSIVFFRSDWSKTWDNLSAQDPFPSVSLDALKFLHLERNILFHGHEPLDTDSTDNLEGEAWLLHHNFAQAEGVANLDLVAESGCLVSVGFLKALGGTGGYARYVAICPASHPHGETIRSSPGAPLPQQTAPLRRGKDGVLRADPDATPTDYCQNDGALGCEGGKLVE